eukprot:TRINITY_DN77079_c0_g1_i1.p1 TRINITY_DN77079_c0_g1~~TRINITY_DN77079_c0_g1_i1.p1  ORF type:complete len:316 (-),score=111.87 TRINITY_DN77079_c0_g1_i1:438-1319(-)
MSAALGDLVPVWKADDSADRCNLCIQPFGVFNRRHHCRRCGELVCNSCSGGKAASRFIDGKPESMVKKELKGMHRCCDLCLRLAQASGEDVVMPRNEEDGEDGQVAKPVRQQPAAQSNPPQKTNASTNTIDFSQYERLQAWPLTHEVTVRWVRFDESTQQYSRAETVINFSSSKRLTGDELRRAIEARELDVRSLHVLDGPPRIVRDDFPHHDMRPALWHDDNDDANSNDDDDDAKHSTTSSQAVDVPPSWAFRSRKTNQYFIDVSVNETLSVPMYVWFHASALLKRCDSSLL